MQRKCIIKDMCEGFWHGQEIWGEYKPGFLEQSAAEAYQRLVKVSQGLPKNVKFEQTQFNRMVELNQIMRGDHTVTMTLSPRRGYKVATFTFTKGV